MSWFKAQKKKLILIPMFLVLPILLGANACEKAIDDIMRRLGETPGTFYNYGQDGQIVFEAHCRSLDFTRDTEFDRLDQDGKKIEDSSVVTVSCGNNLISTVGFTSVYMTDGTEDFLFADSQKFANLRIQNNNRGIPLVNYAWREVKDQFTGTARVASVCDQYNNPILAFAADHVTMYSTEVDKSTMFKLDNDGENESEDGYVWVSRASYTALDTSLMNSDF